MLRKAACLSMAVLILTPVAALAQNSGKQKAAVEAAQKWLGLIDQGQYAESWKEASASFRDHITQQNWENALHAVRAPLGKLLSRKLKDSSYRTSLPGAPDGEYVVMQFDTSFANKNSAVETVTFMLDSGHTWKAAGYFIR